MLRRSAILALVFAAAPAQASDHLLKVNEVLLSAQSDPAIQYIELFDASPESFPNTPYRVELFDAAGQLLGQVLTPTISGGVGSEFLIGTAAADLAFGTTRDATLGITLPRDGQACFRNGLNTFIHCLRWGCISSIVGGAASQAGEAPPDGSSTQRQAGGTYQLAIPTPALPNGAGVAIAPCTIIFNDDFESDDTDNWSAVEPP